MAKAPNQLVIIAFLWHFLIYEHLGENLMDVSREVCQLLEQQIYHHVIKH